MSCSDIFKEPVHAKSNFVIFVPDNKQKVHVTILINKVAIEEVHAKYLWLPVNV